MKKVITLAFLFFALAATAQINDSAKGRVNVFSSVGISRIDNDYKPAAGNSIQTTTGLELQLGRSSSLGGALSFDSYGYEKSGAGYNLDGSLRATALALFYRYKFGSGTWQPYLKAGGGTAWISLPTVTVSPSTTTIGKEVQNVGLALAELGLQVRVLSRYSLLFGVERKWMAESSLADNTSLKTMGVKVGLVSAF